MAIAEGSIPFLIADALRGYSHNFRWLSSINPYRFELNGRVYSAHASAIHFAARDNPDEWRIQVASAVRMQQATREKNGDTALYIGFFPDEPAFTGWEAEYLDSFQSKDVGTVYVPHSDGALAMRQEGALTISRTVNLGRSTSKVTLPTGLLGLYVENTDAFHAARRTSELVKATRQFAAFVEMPAGVGMKEETVELGGKRRKVTSTRTAYPRDSAFRDRIMRAYDGSCSICGRQLGLVEAAHIIPHAHPTCTDAVSNGIALCVEHHRLYDDALLLPYPGRMLKINEARVEHLANIGQGSGIDAIRALAAGGYKVPKDVQSRPDDGFLERGASIRLGTDA